MGLSALFRTVKDSPLQAHLSAISVHSFMNGAPVIISLETGSFTVLNTKLEDLFVVKYVAYIHPSSFTIINVTVHGGSMVANFLERGRFILSIAFSN